MKNWIGLIGGITIGLFCFGSITSTPYTLSREASDLLRGGQGGLPGQWISSWDAFCQRMPECQTDGCGNNEPNSSCSKHVARWKVEGAADLNCGVREGLDCYCSILISQATCSNQEGQCAVINVGTPPNVGTVCAQIPLPPQGTYFILAPQDCSFFCL